MKKIILLFSISFLVLGGCTSIQSMPDIQEDRLTGCNFVQHLRCIYLTGGETIDDGLQLKWTRHWFQMSYIGRACERQYGRTVALILESLFAIPHYAFIAIGNGFAAMASPFSSPELDEDSNKN